MDSNKIIAFSHNLIKGGFFYLKIETKPDLLTTNNPFYQYKGGRLVCINEITEMTSLIAFTGAKYSDMIRRREGYKTKATAKEFKACNIIYKWEIPNIIGIGSSGYYLRYHFYPNGIKEHYFMIDGKMATKEENAMLNKFKRKHSANAPRWNIPTELNFSTRDIKVENIISIKQGDNVYNR